jgi:peptidyl-prolyl cis-trans isomerase A (cyclophilin A)
MNLRWLQFGLLVCALFTAAQAEIVRVLLVTAKGAIELELYPDKAPGTVANFLHYVDHGFYVGGAFHRAVTMANQPANKIKIEVIQAGGNPAREGEELPPIALERTRDTGLKHLDGTISMARLEPNTATSDFFICVNDQPELDFGGQRNPDGQGFAAFGQVIRGMEVVQAIQQAPVDVQKLTPPITIVQAKRLSD